MEINFMNEIPKVPTEEDIQEELLRIDDDIKELSQYERNLRQAANAIAKYINDWQVQLRRIRKEIEILERKRLDLEAIAIMKSKKYKKDEKGIDKVLKCFMKLSKQQQKEIILRLYNE